MSESNIEPIQKELDEIEAAYERDFAGKDRHTCDPEKLDGFVVKTKHLLGELDKLGALTATEDSAKLRTEIERRQAVYEREGRLVRAATEMGESFERFSMEGAAANFVFDRYGRHFAGQSRDTRDLGLIKELGDELKGIRKRMLAVAGKKLPEAMQNDLELVSANIDRYQGEEREIPKAYAIGTLEEQADRLAFLANHQFACYQAFFAGHSRLTRRPNHLVRIIDNLKRYRTGMFDLKNRGFGSQSNVDNIGVIDGRLKSFENELTEIRKVRSGVKLADIMGSLGGAANELFQKYRDTYAGKDRTTVSLDVLSLMIDQLDELRRQMEELGRVEKNEMNTSNQKVVREYQAMWVTEFQAIKAVQATSA